MSGAAPIRFLALVVGGWILVRFAVLAPGWRTDIGPIATALVPSARASAPRLRTTVSLEPAPSAVLSARPPSWPPAAPAARSPSALVMAFPEPERTIEVPAALAPALVPIGLPGVPFRRRGERWSGSAWVLLRDDRARPTLAPGGTLSGSQAGARLLYAIGDGLALSARVYLPLRQARGAEAAAGLDWQPSARIPIRILAERRLDLGGEGRSAFAFAIYGGFDRLLPRGLRIDAYGQAGIVGTSARDLFADGAARVSAPVGEIEAGLGLWGGAQPGAARLDAGPSLSWRLPIRPANLRLQADWRFRLAGDAAPGSGPALTLAADF
jgi:hypothetical protein